MFDRVRECVCVCVLTLCPLSFTHPPIVGVWRKSIYRQQLCIIIYCYYQTIDEYLSAQLPGPAL